MRQVEIAEFDDETPLVVQGFGIDLHLGRRLLKCAQGIDAGLVGVDAQSKARDAIDDEHVGFLSLVWEIPTSSPLI